jgi:hypothetical protein
LLAIDATEYICFRAVYEPWRSLTTDCLTWEPCFFPKKWEMLDNHKNDDDEAPANLAAPHCHHFVNVCTGATLWIEQMSFEEYDDFLTDAKGLKFSTVSAPKRCASSTP